MSCQTSNVPQYEVFDVHKIQNLKSRETNCFFKTHCKYFQSKEQIQQNHLECTSDEQPVYNFEKSYSVPVPPRSMSFVGSHTFGFMGSHTFLIRTVFFKGQVLIK